MLVSGMSLTVSTSFLRLPPDGVGTPSMPASWPMATWIPTPVRKPMRTVRDKKSAMNPSFTSRATMSSTPAISASRPASATYSDEPVAAMPTNAAAITAAVAESAPTTRWRDDPNIANTNRGSTIVYMPVTTGMPAIVAYPMTSGMASAARVTPASTSAGNRDRSSGNSPSSTDTRGRTMFAT